MIRKPTEVLTGIEIGTSAIKVCTGHPLGDGSISIIGIDETPCVNNVVKGEIQDVELIRDLLTDTLTRVEAATGCGIGKAYLAITGAHIASVNAQGEVPIRAEDRKITNQDIVDATRHARGYRLPREQISINSCQRAYLIDGERPMSQPLGMVASRLTADIHFIYGNYNSVQTSCNLVEEALGVPATDIAFAGIADMYGLALEAEPSNGVLVVDIGAGVTEYVVYYQEGCMHSGQVTIGCEQLANDLSIGLQLPIPKARELLRSNGSAMRRAEGGVRHVKVQTALAHPPRTFKESTIQTIIETRLLELFQIIRDDLAEHRMLELLSNGIVLCGGGALIPHIAELSASFFTVPARIGQPGNVTGAENEIQSPRYVTPIGLLHLGYQLQEMEKSNAVPLWKVMKHDLLRMANVAKRAIKF